MLTRRGFLGSLAALVVSPVAAKAVPVAAAPTATLWKDRLWTVPGNGGYYVFTPTSVYHWTSVHRRDDGDTILELR